MSKADDEVAARRRARIRRRKTRDRLETSNKGVRRASSDKRKKRGGGYGSIKYY
jgi:hypothetical protein